MWRRCGRWWPSLRAEEAKIREGGGAKAIEAQHKKQRLTARERIGLLLDEGTELFELGLHAAHGMYEEWGGAPAAGVVTGLGRVHGRLFMLIVNDATVKAGAFFPDDGQEGDPGAEHRHGKQFADDLPGGQRRGVSAAAGRRVSGSGRLWAGVPQQRGDVGEGNSTDHGDHGNVRRRRRVSAGDVRPHSDDRGKRAVSGRSGAGAGGDWAEGERGRAGRSEDARGDQRHGGLPRSRRRGVHRAGALAGGEDGSARGGAVRSREAVAPLYAAEEMYGIYESDPSRQYDMREIIARVVDGSRFDEYKAGYGETLLCGYARIDGHAVGIVANQKMHATQIDHHSGNKLIEFGGVIYTESAEKAARFIMDCNQGRIPLVFLHDVNGFMVGRDAEWSGIIRAGAKMVNAVSNSVVPKITVIVGGSFGAGHYAMCGKAYDPRFVFAWPTARYSVMSGESAANTLVEIKLKQLEREGKAVDEVARKELYDSIRSELHGADDTAVWSGTAVDRQDYRPGRDARGAGMGAGGGAVQSCGGEIQRGHFADVAERS